MFLAFKFVLLGRQVLHKSLMSSYSVRLLHDRHSIGHNGLGLSDVAYFEAQKFNRRTNVYLTKNVSTSTSPAILPN